MSSLCKPLATLVNRIVAAVFFQQASDNVAEDETSCLYQWSRSIIAASRYLARGNAILGHVGIIQRPGDESTTSIRAVLSRSLARSLSTSWNLHCCRVTHFRRRLLRMQGSDRVLQLA